MANNVIQYTEVVSLAGNVFDARPFQILVPMGFAFRVRYFESRYHGLLNVDSDARQAVSILAEDPPRLADVAFMGFNRYMGFAAWSMESSGTAGLMAVKAVQRVELWDLDYRLVMPPTLHTVSITNAQAITGVLAGELVPASLGERNAFAITQGGAK